MAAQLQVQFCCFLATSHWKFMIGQRASREWLWMAENVFFFALHYGGRACGYQTNTREPWLALHRLQQQRNGELGVRPNVHLELNGLCAFLWNYGHPSTNQCWIDHGNFGTSSLQIWWNCPTNPEIQPSSVFPWIRNEQKPIGFFQYFFPSHIFSLNSCYATFIISHAN